MEVGPVCIPLHSVSCLWECFNCCSWQVHGVLHLSDPWDTNFSFTDTSLIATAEMFNLHDYTCACKKRPSSRLRRCLKIYQLLIRLRLPVSFSPCIKSFSLPNTTSWRCASCERKNSVCRRGATRPRAPDKRSHFHMWRWLNILDIQSRIADKWWLSTFRDCRSGLTTLYLKQKKSHVNKWPDFG